MCYQDFRPDKYRTSVSEYQEHTPDTTPTSLSDVLFLPDKIQNGIDDSEGMRWTAGDK